MPFVAQRPIIVGALVHGAFEDIHHWRNLYMTKRIFLQSPANPRKLNTAYEKLASAQESLICTRLEIL
jgi:hypothetical protein